MKSARRVLVSGAPFIHDERTTARDAWLVSALLVPVLCWEALLSGPGIVETAGLAIVTALVADIVQSGLRRRFEIDDGSAFLTGLLIALLLPAGLPLWIPPAAAAFAVLVVKGAFGGLGSNWMNPALGGLAFAWLDWPSLFSAALPGSPTGGRAPLVPGLSAFVQTFDDRLSAALNSLLFQPLGANLPSGYFASLLGVHQGSVPGMPVGLVLLASTILIGMRVIRWQIPAAMFAFFALPIWIFGDRGSGGPFSGDVLGHSLAGIFLFVAFFMATDPVTSPSRTAKMVIFGSGSGLIAFAFAYSGAPAPAPILAVLFMNIVMPFVDEAGHRIARGGRS